ncbi:polymerase III polypeptide H [Coprinopsis cinerea okayama7|uniref:Polymerase III polypeptide H n=1 Tax=Coprinopsis cinerea (strain Okayama-7 / 130 / ATCC MYA-4618 / FGSC 9003) TaxID=240176 RepID=A8PDR7_COPC7|nr:polymerase III polypeptide H [Coprinopsis cinerea okayama7\|eukprot:XP_001840650.1 polymerase III polypeptide H [Coprinopsis cinerea okayama7\
MFSLAVIKDTVPIHPQHFGIPPEEAITAELNKKYANRVLHDVGLCICVFDLTEVGDGRVRYGDGFLWYKVTFRMTVFRPFVSEVVVAKVKSSDERGIRLTMGFFDDIYIPAIYLPQPSVFDRHERAYFWLPDSPLTDSNDLLNTPTSERMYIDQNEVVRVRVEQDEFFDDEPGPVKVVEGVVQERVTSRPPYTITCSIAEQGLGPVAWWAGAQQIEEGAEEDGMEEA